MSEDDLQKPSIKPKLGLISKGIFSPNFSLSRDYHQCVENKKKKILTIYLYFSELG